MRSQPLQGNDHKECKACSPESHLRLLLLGLTIASADAQIRIGLMVSATGPTSAIGIPQKNTGDILPRTIGGATVEYISLEDGGDTTRAVQNVKKLIAENNIDALIGPSTTPNAFAILDVIADAKVPMMATVGTSADRRAARREEALGVQDDAERRPDRRRAA